jgi:hypothetical protein
MRRTKKLRYLHESIDVFGARLPRHRNPEQAERKLRLDCRERLSRALAAGQAVGNEADAVAARGLRAREIEDMTKQPADRRAKYMDDVERSIGHGEPAGSRRPTWLRKG